MLTTGWRVIDGDAGDVMMLHGWGMEVTPWLNPIHSPATNG